MLPTMVWYRTRRSNLMVVIAAVIVGAVVVLIVQDYVLNTVMPLHKYKQHLHNEKQELCEAGSRLSAPVGVINQTTKLQVKTILMHTMPYWYELKSGISAFSACQYPCTLTLDKDLVDEVDCVVVYSHEFSSDTTPWFSRDQVWVFFASESPVNHRNAIFRRPEWRHRFNWTMTYRRDSDFYFGYGDVVKPRSTQPTRDFSTIVAGKTKLVAWFVSNCKTRSKREEFANTLKDFIQLDVYGSCGPLVCGSERDQECMNMLSKDYFFYLSFENSLCNDYLTEKVYRMMKLIDIVPVVMGGANYSALLPKNSYIDVSEFPTVKALADYLQKVAGDRKLYESYLTWKNQWQVIEPIRFSFCEFCQRLHHPERWARVYADIDAWWVEGQCHEPPPIIRS